MSDLKRHYLDDYAKKDFKSEYEKYLENPSEEKCPYKDIDAADNEDENFYMDLAEFLTKALNSKYEFEKPNKPNKSDKPFAIRFQDSNPPSENPDAKYIYLRSDQFGFSAPRASMAWNGEISYPYARYLSVNLDDNKGADEKEKRRFVAECIYETRTIGGSFIWPIVNTSGKWCSTYNKERGARTYIEDRVDITLHEVSCFYDVYSQIKEKYYSSFEEEYTDFIERYEEECPKNILFSRCQGEDEKKAMYRWLKIFETFNGYVVALKFDDFVIKSEEGKYLIRDMASNGGESTLNIAKIKPIRQMNPDELYTLLTNVKERTESRSKAIEKVLSN